MDRKREDRRAEELFKSGEHSAREFLIMTAVLVLESDYITCPKNTEI